MLQTLERTQTFDARVLNADHAAALRALTGPSGLPLLPCLHPALEEGQIVGDYAGQEELQAAAALLPLYAEDAGAARRLHTAAAFFAVGAALGH